MRSTFGESASFVLKLKYFEGNFEKRKTEETFFLSKIFSFLKSIFRKFCSQ